MTDFEAIWLGLVQGLTEFLPVSSSGHLVLVSTVMGVVTQGIVFEVALHVATLVAVLAFYRRRVGALLSGALRGDREAIQYGLKLGVATLPLGLALLIQDQIESAFESPALVAVALLVTGALVFSTRRTAPAANRDALTWGGAFLVGIAQLFAITPGISRSGSTVAAALALGVRPVVAAEFSFLLSVIAVSGAAAVKLPEVQDASGQDLRAIAFGCLAALVSGVFALALFVRLLRDGRFYRFAYYAWAVGVGFLVWRWVG